MATSSIDNTVRIWNVSSGQCEAVLKQPDCVQCIAYSHDGKRLAVSCDHGQVQVFDENYSAIGIEWPKLMGISALAFSSDDNLLAIVGADACICNAKTGQVNATLKNGGFKTATFSPDGQSLLTTSFDHLELWDRSSGQSIWAKSFNSCLSAGYSTDGRQIFLAEQSKVHTLDAATGNELHCINDVWCFVFAKFTPDGKYLITWDFDSLIDDSPYLYDLKRETDVANLHGLSGYPECGAFSPDGRYCAAGSGDGSVMIWNIASVRFGSYLWIVLLVCVLAIVYFRRRRNRAVVDRERASILHREPPSI